MHCRRPFLKLSCAAALVLAGCAANPVTHQQDFVLMSEAQELALGRESHPKVLQEYGQYADPALQAYVQQVGEQLAAHSHRPELVYRFTVLDSKDVNAFALPGGYIYITRGILAYLNSEAELAAVLGHEIGHVTARHAVRQYTAAQTANIGATLGAIFLPELRAAGANQLVNVFGTALLRGYGRDQELEADHLGAGYIARAGYDPTAMLNVLRTLKAQEEYDTQLARQEGREPRAYHGVFSTHPDSDTRLQQVVGEARQLQGAGADRTNRDQYLSHIDGLVVGDSPKQGFVRGDAFFHPDLGFGFKIPAGWSVKNSPDLVILTAPGGEARMQMLAEDLNKHVSPREFMIERLGLSPLAHDGALNSNGLEGYTAVAPINTSRGRREARVSVLYLNTKAYIFAALVDNSANVSRYDPDFLDIAHSFHGLTPEERNRVHPLRIKLTRAVAGADYAGLAKQSPYNVNGEAELRLLNGQYGDGEPVAGSLIKTVQ